MTPPEPLMSEGGGVDTVIAAEYGDEGTGHWILKLTSPKGELQRYPEGVLTP